MVPLSKYARIKNRYVIAYAGRADEYLDLLLYVRPHIEAALPGVDVYLSCHDDYWSILSGQQRVLPYSTLKETKTQYAYIREVCCDGKTHPVLNLLTESNIVVKRPTPLPATGGLCVVVPTGNFPTKPLTTSEIAWCQAAGRSEGFDVKITTDVSPLASMVIGVESRTLFEAAIRGAKTALVPTGVGTELYKTLFPAGRIVKL